MPKAVIILIIASIYALTAQLGFFLTAPGTLIAPVWPPAGLALAAILIFGNSALVGVFIGCFIANAHLFWTPDIKLISILCMMVPAIGGVIQAYVGKLSLIKFTGSYNFFQNTQSVLVFILITAFGSCLINASFSTFLLVLMGSFPFAGLLYHWLTWWIADAVGVVTVTSTIIAWTVYWKVSILPSQLLKLVITWVFILIIGYITLHSATELAYVYIPFAIWSAFQFDIRLALLTGWVISALCLYISASTNYLVLSAASINTSISLMQLFITIIYLTILLMHVILSDRKKAYDNLQTLNNELENIVQTRTSELVNANKQLEVQKNKAIDAFEALKQSHARLMQSEKLASLGMLTAGVAHEIKHPLHATTANMENIQKILNEYSNHVHQASLGEELQEDFNHLNEDINSLIAASRVGINRTAGVIADLCAFARSDEPEMILTDINRNIDSTLNLLSSEIKSNINIIKEYGAIPQVLCHPGKINQVIMNILVNAIHALQNRRNSVITIKTEHANNTIIINIKDNGPGMKPEVLDKLFTPFMTTKAEGMGSGLGLFLSSNIIKEHRGKIKVQSELDQGTEFIISMPIQEE